LDHPIKQFLRKNWFDPPARLEISERFGTHFLPTISQTNDPTYVDPDNQPDFWRRVVIQVAIEDLPSGNQMRLACTKTLEFDDFLTKAPFLRLFNYHV
jgi:hypothetical protein